MAREPKLTPEARERDREDISRVMSRVLRDKKARAPADRALLHAHLRLALAIMMGVHRAPRVLSTREVGADSTLSYATGEAVAEVLGAQDPSEEVVAKVVKRQRRTSRAGGKAA